MGGAHERILITGAVGLVGRALLEALRADGESPRGVDRCSPDGVLPGSTEFVLGDLRDEHVCGEALDGVTAVVHCAAAQYQSRPHSWQRGAFFDQNLESTRTLTAACRAARVGKFVLLSSDMVYGMPAGRPFSEDDPPRPIGPYGRSKLTCERLCEELFGSGAVVTILRPRLIVGAGRVGVLTALFERVRKHQAVPVLGDGEGRYQMVAVADVVEACRLALRAGRPGVFNLGSADPPSVRALLTELCARAKSRARLVHLSAGLANAGLTLLDWVGLSPLAPEQYRIASRDYVLATDRARTQLGWVPRFGDADMLWAAYESYLLSLGIGVVEARCGAGRCAGTVCLTHESAACEHGTAPRSSTAGGTPQTL